MILFQHFSVACTCKRSHNIKNSFSIHFAFSRFIKKKKIIMSDPPAVKKTARTFDLQAMVNQARSGAQERSKVDWTNEIEKTKEENESRIAEMKLKADEAAKKLHISTNNNNGHEDDDDNDEDDFGPSLDLATAPIADDGDTSSDDEDKNQSEVEEKYLIYPQENAYFVKILVD
jgi:hypothetical protein